MYKYNEIEKELRKIITPETVIVCIGSSRVKFDIFGPLCGTYLKKNKVPCYGDMRNPVNALTMNDKLKLIYEIDKNENKNIIAIDACVAIKKDKINEIRLDSTAGAKPGAGVGRNFPTIGNTSIIMYTLTAEELNRVCKGCADVSNKQLIKRQAKLVADMIAKIYHEVCNEVLI